MTKKRALKMLKGDSIYKFSILWDYSEELRVTNFCSIVVLLTVDDVGGIEFNKMYVCLEAFKEGFKAGIYQLLGERMPFKRP